MKEKVLQAMREFGAPVSMSINSLNKGSCRPHGYWK